MCSRAAGCLVFALLLLGGCSHVVTATPEEIRVDTGWPGEIAPGARVWLSYLQAREQCAVHGRRPRTLGMEPQYVTAPAPQM